MSKSNRAKNVVRYTLTASAHRRCPFFSDSQVQQAWTILWEERLRIFRKVFPWIDEAIRELAGLPTEIPLGAAEDHKTNFSSSKRDNCYW